MATDPAVVARRLPWRFARQAGAPLMVAAVLVVLGCRPAGEVVAAEPAERGAQARSVPSWDTPLRSAADAGAELDSAAVALARGKQLLREGDAAGAARMFASAGAITPGLRDWASLWEARARAEAGVSMPVEALLERIPADLRTLREWQPRLRVLEVQGRRHEIDPLLQDALSRISDPVARLSVESARGEAFLRGGDTAQAVAAWVRALGLDDGGAAGTRAMQRLQALDPTGPEALRALLDAHLRRRDLTAASTVVGSMRTSRLVSTPTRWRGSVDVAVARARLRPSDAEVATLLAMAGDAPDAPLRGELRLAAARVRLRQGRMEDARTNLLRAVETGARHAAMQEALFLLGDLEHDAGHHDVARRHFAEARAIDPASEWGAESAMREGLIRYHHGDDLAAAAVFEAYRETHADGWRGQQAAFWAAMSYRRMGERSLAELRFAEAVTLDPLGYYGLRARHFDPPTPSPTDLPAGPLPDPALDVVARGGLLRIDVLRRHGLVDEAEVEERRLPRLFGTVHGGLHALAESWLDRGRIVDAARLGRLARREAGGWDRRLLQIVFPLPYREPLLRHARAAGVDPWLTAGLIRQESLFQPEARSSAGATGLMQLQPRVAAALALRTDGVRVSEGELRAPEVNLRLGTRHLRELVERHEGRLDAALVAYNAGPARLARWRAFPEYADPDQFLERIPFRETREYVRVVQENAAVYAAVYGDGPDSFGNDVTPSPSPRSRNDAAAFLRGRSALPPTSPPT